MKLQDKVAVVTGAASGIGLKLATEAIVGGRIARGDGRPRRRPSAEGARDKQRRRQ